MTTKTNTLVDALAHKGIHLFNDKAENLYKNWETPDVIISDGAYGVSGFKGDPHTPHFIADWYEAHIEAWSKKAKPGTTLWFWNTEVGWANVHPILQKNGWDYLTCNIWNKGIAHIAGNVNTKTLKSFPVVTEVCVHYIKRAELKVAGETTHLKDWIRAEWNRAGLVLWQANEACGVANAASRKYLTKDHLWYAPPSEHFAAMVIYANEKGNETGKPYYSLDGINPMTQWEYEQLFPLFNGKYGYTNVWDIPALHSKERIKAEGKSAYFHLNQKPLTLMKLLLEISSKKNSVIWEPFGGLFSASFAALSMGRTSYATEMDEAIFKVAVQRFENQLIQKTITFDSIATYATAN
jgi:DNA modification methylase